MSVLASGELEAESWQLRRLLNGFCAEIGEDMPDDDAFRRLCAAITEGGITFFAARRGCRIIGMCSVASCFSTYRCAPVGVFDDFFVEPVFRHGGAARALCEAAQSWCRDRGVTSLTVSCAECDRALYAALGFTSPLGCTLACAPDATRPDEGK